MQLQRPEAKQRRRPSQTRNRTEEAFFSIADGGGESLLLFGDDAGGVTCVTFHQPLNSLFSKDEVDSVQCLFWPDMAKHAEYATISYSPAAHK